MDRPVFVHEGGEVLRLAGPGLVHLGDTVDEKILNRLRLLGEKLLVLGVPVRRHARELGLAVRWLLRRLFAFRPWLFALGAGLGFWCLGWLLLRLWLFGGFFAPWEETALRIAWQILRTPFDSFR